MGLLLDLLADEFPHLRREQEITAAVAKATTPVEVARATVTTNPDGTRTAHPSAVLTVPALLDEIDRLNAALPDRGDKIAAWLKAERDEHPKSTVHWTALDELLDLYRLHADTGTRLDQHACEGRCCADCASGPDRG
ncbi:hypothetical protein Q8791_23140 [Nocardiopsis sp. CT-R113]|uniref:Uncharacterized protein n=1 Tax=Nocardiopsis codii TaxID=3065942 RepID=A0ABU7KDL3_9ACTN|nr:hypothetical protein [Nocardiopsis sp. CT-R113]MEE2040117.1 hypothetical protein [Nocardiopsis sp. CT-R113]